eukprot:TRINITY_DN17203_c0_g1_i1.p1 TRINITY_DN17203_c0_g1~~TRINITY_DN17203_c0_g1_i1.p1  ORF type:complete len:249 (-),score=55.69 TRINITY_DN17203_c0_g1_i1:112-858(-)
MRLSGPEKTIYDVDLSFDARMALSSGNDSAIYLYDLKYQKPNQCFNGHSSKIPAAKFFGDKTAYSGSYDRTIKTWDVENSSNLLTIPCVSACNYVHMSSDGSIIGSAHLDSHVRFWSSNSKELICDLGEEHKKSVSCIKFPATGPLCLTTSKDCTIKVIDTRTWGVIRTITDGEYRDVPTWAQFAISPDGALVAAGSGSGTVIIWDIESGKKKKYLRNHSAPVTSCAWSPYGVNLVSTDKSGGISIWS